MKTFLSIFLFRVFSSGEEYMWLLLIDLYNLCQSSVHTKALSCKQAYYIFREYSRIQRQQAGAKLCGSPNFITFPGLPIKKNTVFIGVGSVECLQE